MKITDIDSLRAISGAPNPRSVAKQLDRLDRHCLRLVGMSPFVLLATCGADDLCDVTPRGDAPGFVAAPDDRTLLIPDRPGNNRLDSLLNILHRPGVGLLFLVPGIDETLRVNGIAEIRRDPDLLERFSVDGRPPRTVLRVEVREAYLHCGKAFMRSRLWDPTTRVDRAAVPSMGEMLRDQVGERLGISTGESQAEMLERYKATLY
jgi:PPOX class probable FMN-dependent enzyme